ncbi:MAG TPA: glycosyltransferase [Actinoplanes sp.]|nr:glycosyltransferase [Actinoplanes sp.]
MLDTTHRLMDDHLTIARRRTGALVATALRTRSMHARDLLAHAVGGAGTPLAGILDAARDENHEWLAGLGGTGHLAALADLARVIALQELRPGDLRDAYAIYELILAVHGTAATPAHQVLHVQLAYRLGLRDRVTALLATYPQLPEAVRETVLTDLANPYAGGDDPAGWAGRFQRLLPGDRVRLAPDGPGSAFDRLTTPDDLLTRAVLQRPARTPALDGELVSVILTGPADGVALRSLLAQSHRNLEILLVGSWRLTAPTGAEISQDPENLGAEPSHAGGDPRVRVVDASGEGGDGRNAALAAARGAFVAFADADTYAHPDRLAHQVAALQADPALVATTTVAIEVGDDLTLTRVGGNPRKLSVGSLVFRREAVLARIGFLDPVTSGAGAEYLGRIKAVFGDDAVRHLDDAAYALVRHPGARAEFRPGWTHPVRAAYTEAYTAWHERIRAGEADPYRSANPSTRPFAAPARLTAVGPGTPGRREFTPRYDVILGGEWTSYGGPQKSMIEEIRALTARGRRVAVMHLDAYRFMSSRPRVICAQVRALIDDGTVDRVLPGDDVETSLLVVRYPPVLQFTTDLPSGVRAKRVVILANQAPCERDGSDTRYVPRTCADNARRLFGATALWAPQGPAVRDLLGAELPADELAPFDIPGIIDADAWHTERTWLRGERPVLGKHSRDNWAKWPADRTRLLLAYPAELDIDVRLMGGITGAKALLGDQPVPANWRTYDYDEIDVRTFLNQLDFYVYFPHPNMIEAFGRAILEAMAAGCVVLMPHHFRRTFGDAALYCDPDEVAGVVRHLHRDPEAFLQLSRYAQQHVRRQFSHAAYADLISTLID